MHETEHIWQGAAPFSVRRDVISVPGDPEVSFLAPVALVALGVPLAIYVIHWLFGSRRRVRVPAIFLWAELPQAPTGRSRRRRPPFSLLLLLQLLAAVLAALALARPAAAGDPPRHLALILDASASMQATDVAPTRFDAARARAGLSRYCSGNSRFRFTILGRSFITM